MGRRKIEIAPIANERNRSVTFLKRKTGLFKKAYELGVLCSVDVCVIVFETKAGQPVKLHQYTSCPDIQTILQRKTEHAGEVETKYQRDFFTETAGDDDDDDGPATGYKGGGLAHPGAGPRDHMEPVRLSLPTRFIWCLY
ncbi:hypothetical protein DL96DRAFT_1628043 [Flagelloscypha sp. PMI_526]|nr:hypothetical protein DL96DRAFT_1639889 [Flagelloscypha sp. PMI_526]KAH8810228.1 hypothetical protein DL96DRAFT_1628043 [Flagelloscypha sp. PMI_526]